MKNHASQQFCVIIKKFFYTNQQLNLNILNLTTTRSRYFWLSDLLVTVLLCITNIKYIKKTI